MKETLASPVIVIYAFQPDFAQLEVVSVNAKLTMLVGHVINVLRDLVRSLLATHANVMLLDPETASAIGMAELRVAVNQGILEHYVTNVPLSISVSLIAPHVIALFNSAPSITIVILRLVNATATKDMEEDNVKDAQQDFTAFLSV